MTASSTQPDSIARATRAGSSSTATELLIVVLCYRVVDLTIDCLKSLAPQICDIPNAHVVVCDNCSDGDAGGDSVERLHHAIIANGWTDWVTLQAIRPNLGFTGGNNAVLREAMKSAAPAKYCLLLNADTVVLPGALARLHKAIESAPHVGVMGMTLQSPDGQPQHCKFRDHSPISEFLRGADSGILNRLLGRDEFPLEPKPAAAAEFGWVSFAAAAIRREVLQQVGLLDEGYFLYFDDADYCRMARDANWKVATCPDSHVVHYEGQSNDVPESSRTMKRRPQYYYVSRSRYFAKHYGVAGLWLANLLWSAGATLAWVRRLLGSNKVHTCEREWADIWTNAFAPIRKSNAVLLPAESRIVN